MGVMPLLLLWTLTGLAWLVTFLGMFSIGIFVLPVAVGLLVLSIVLTTRRPGEWPAIAGLGLALSVGVAWLGWTLAAAGPSELSCSGSSNGPAVCTSGGRVVDPDAVDWGVATPWFAAAFAVALVTLVSHRLARTLLTSPLRHGPRSPAGAGG
jgi:hypothetical protein